MLAHLLLLPLLQRGIEGVFLIVQIPPYPPFAKGGNMVNTPLWKRGARGDFLNRCSFNYETINRMITLNAEN